MAVVMVAGNQPVIPNSIFDGVRTMTANIVLEMGYAADLHRGALIATGVVLFVFIMLMEHHDGERACAGNEGKPPSEHGREEEQAEQTVEPSLFEWTYTSENVSLMPALIDTILMALLALVHAKPPCL